MAKNSRHEDAQTSPDDSITEATPDVVTDGTEAPSEDTPVFDETEAAQGGDPVDPGAVPALDDRASDADAEIARQVESDAQADDDAEEEPVAPKGNGNDNEPGGGFTAEPKSDSPVWDYRTHGKPTSAQRERYRVVGEPD